MNRQLTYNDERSDFAHRLAYINQHRHPIALLLDGISNPRNIGAIFRLADAARIDHLYLFNTTLPTQKSLKKVARSTDKYVPYTTVYPHDIDGLFKKYHTIALEITSESTSYIRAKIQPPLLLIVGEEAHGVSNFLLQKVTQTVHIPMYGINTSMNVATATAIVLFDFLHKLE